jgi:zinc protease
MNRIHRQMETARRAARLAALVSFCAVLWSAQTQAETSVECEQYRLPNGLNVILSRDARTSNVAVNLSFRVGAADETPGHTGYAHVFEHMWFQGSAHISKATTDKLMASIGAEEDGTTEFDRTYYYAQAPANQLETLLWQRSDQMGFLALDQARLQNQREVVLNERSQRYENDPNGRIWLVLCNLLFPSPHPYHDAIIGTAEDIVAAKLPDLRAFFDRYYAASNATVAIVGDFDPTQARALVQKYFGTLPRGPATSRPETIAVAPPASEVRRSLKAQNAPRRISIGWLAPRAFTDDDAALVVLAELLAGGRASVLYRELVVDKKLAHRVECSADSMTYAGLFSCDLYPRDGVSFAALLAGFDAVMARIEEGGPQAEDVASAKIRHSVARWTRLERLLDRADMLNRYYLATGQADYLQRDVQRFASVDAAAIRRSAQKWLGPVHRVVIDMSKEGE